MDEGLVLMIEQDANINGILHSWAVTLASLVSQLLEVHTFFCVLI